MVVLEPVGVRVEVFVAEYVRDTVADKLSDPEGVENKLSVARGDEERVWESERVGVNVFTRVAVTVPVLVPVEVPVFVD